MRVSAPNASSSRAASSVAKRLKERSRSEPYSSKIRGRWECESGRDNAAASGTWKEAGSTLGRSGTVDVHHYRPFLSGISSRGAGQRITQSVGSAATILDHEQRQILECPEIGAVHDRAAVPLSADQAGASEHRKVRRHRVLRNTNGTGQFAGGKTFGFAFHQQSKGLETGALSESSQRTDCAFLFHVSGHMDQMSRSGTSSGRALR